MLVVLEASLVQMLLASTEAVSGSSPVHYGQAPALSEHVQAATLHGAVRSPGEP